MHASSSKCMCVFVCSRCCIYIPIRTCVRYCRSRTRVFHCICLAVAAVTVVCAFQRNTFTSADRNRLNSNGRSLRLRPLSTCASTIYIRVMNCTGPRADEEMHTVLVGEVCVCVFCVCVCVCLLTIHFSGHMQDAYAHRVVSTNECTYIIKLYIPETHEAALKRAHTHTK